MSSQADPTESWVTFHGRAIESRYEWILTDLHGNGSVAVDLGDARLIGPLPEVRIGARVRVLKRPFGGNTPANAPPPQIDCPCGKTCCIGLVTICCGNHVVLGRGRGVWNECPPMNRQRAAATRSQTSKLESQRQKKE